MEAAFNHVEIVNKLGDAKGIKIDLKDKEGRTAFMHAADRRQLDTLKFLKKKKAKINVIDKKKNNALTLASTTDE